VPVLTPNSPPFALAAPGFPLRSLAALASRAALGGPREVLLAAMQAARLIDGAVGYHPLPETLRKTRATAARSWLSALALPLASRQVIARVIDASAQSERAAMAQAWEAVVALVSPGTDLAARAELRRVSLLLSPAA
jgi:hypothetical protein